MLSSLWQTMIGAGAAVVGGLGAAIWQTRRADDVAQRIRQAERRERALLELNAEASKARAFMSGLFNQARTAVLTGGPAKVSTDAYIAARDGLAELRAQWDGTAAAVLPDQDIGDAVADCWGAVALRLWYPHSVSYSQPAPIEDLVPRTQLTGDLGAVYTAISNLSRIVRQHVDLLQARPPLLSRVLTRVRGTARRRDREISKAAK